MLGFPGDEEHAGRSLLSLRKGGGGLGCRETFLAVRVAGTETARAALHLGNPALIPTVSLNQGILGGTRNEYWEKHLFIS